MASQSAGTAARARRQLAFSASVPPAQSLPEDVAQVFDGLAFDGKALIGTRSLSALLPSTDRFPLLIMERDGGMAADTIATLDQNHASAVFIALAGGGTWRPSGRNSGIPSPDQIRSIEVASKPFSDITLWDVTSARESVVVVDRNAAEAPGDHAYTFTGVRLSGNTVFPVRRAYEPIEIPAAVTDSIVGPYTRNFDEAEIRDVLFLPVFYPPVDAVVAGRDGTIWLAREAVVGESRQAGSARGTGPRTRRAIAPPCRSTAACRITGQRSVPVPT